MSKFKVGDKVKIIECSSESIRIKYINRIATITKLRDNGEYVIDLDNGVYFWYEFEFESYKEPPKEYNIHNLLNDFSEGTEFIKVGGGIKPLKYKILDGNLYFYNYINEIWEKILCNLKRILNMKFTKVEEPKLKPMTFEGAVRTGNKIKFKYSDNYNMAKGFLPFNDAIYFLTTPYFDNNVIRKLILEGTWFAEGVYE